MEYVEFIQNKRHVSGNIGFEPVFMPDFLFDFQKHIIEWGLLRGRGLFAEDCGLGKTIQMLVFAQNIAQKFNKKTLILTPMAVSHQTVKEGEKFGIECKRSKDGTAKDHITVTNYEKLHLFNWQDYECVICDESSILKNFDGKRKAAITEFIKKVRYRLLCTATAAPNDYKELGTSSEALGEMGYMDMLSTFFTNDEKSTHPAWIGSKWRFKPHGESDFWKWVCSWARAIRKPSDLGFNDGGFNLPELIVNEHIVKNEKAFTGQLFPVMARSLNEQREENKLTIDQRCELAAEKLKGDGPAVAWCHLNDEADLLQRLIPGSVQISGQDKDEAREEKLTAFTNGQIETLITKPKIGAFGLNWQHCHRMTYFVSHSFEQYYQAVRRLWRFGQKNTVTVDMIASEGNKGVFLNLKRKAEASEKMFEELVSNMNQAMKIDNTKLFTNKTKVPSWL